MDIVPISVVDSIQDAMPLMVAHWDEVERHKELMVLAPNMEAYRWLEENDALFTFGASADGVLVGYSSSIIHQHLHYKDLRYATNDALFVSKAHRAGRLGYRLIQATELESAKRGAQLMLFHAKPDTALAAILPRMGYVVEDIIFSKAL